MTNRFYLFVQGNRPERFSKAVMCADFGIQALLRPKAERALNIAEILARKRGHKRILPSMKALSACTTP